VQIRGLRFTYKGSEYSGNFGHEGRPGEIGGSAPGGGFIQLVGKQWQGPAYNRRGGRSYLYHATDTNPQIILQEGLKSYRGAGIYVDNEDYPFDDENVVFVGNSPREIANYGLHVFEIQCYEPYLVDTGESLVHLDNIAVIEYLGPIGRPGSRIGGIH